jgi:hypothetical protein
MSADSYARIYVYYPRGVTTGGPEALHQLVATLRELGREAYLVPQPGTENVDRAEQYAHYDAPETSSVDDSEGNAVVTSEYVFRLLRDVKKADRFVWWLSIDNSLLFNPERRLLDLEYQGLLSPRQYGLAKAKVAAKRVRDWGRGDYRLLRELKHLSQSAYAAAFLYSRLNLVSGMLSDYTSPLDVAPSLPASARGRTIAYNPKKAAGVTARLADVYGEGKFIPLANMSRAQVLETLSSSAVYLDLGTHPGKDRMPREAVLSGCVALVARRGSGTFDLDVPVPPHHKLPTLGEPVREAKLLLDRVFNNVDGYVKEQESYLRVISQERDTFRSEVANAFVHRVHC